MSNSPFERYQAKQTAQQNSISKDTDVAKLLKFSNREELWRKIFLTSIIIVFISCIIINFLPIQFIIDKGIEKVISVVGFGIVTFTLFSLLMLLKFHMDYKDLCNKTLPSEKTTNNTSLNKSSINYVLEGKYKNEKITHGTLLYTDSSPFSKRYISSYTIIDKSNKDQYSFWKGALGVALFGGIGAVAGIGGKNKKEYLIAIEWKDGEKSLILINDEYYKVFVKSMF